MEDKGYLLKRKHFIIKPVGGRLFLVPTKEFRRVAKKLYRGYNVKQACKLSLEKWELIVEAYEIIDESGGWFYPPPIMEANDSCALCAIFKNSCVWCPLKDADEVECNNPRSTWFGHSNGIDFPRIREKAYKMVELLKEALAKGLPY